MHGTRLLRGREYEKKWHKARKRMGEAVQRGEKYPTILIKGRKNKLYWRN
jgi:hypothetical protein